MKKPDYLCFATLNRLRKKGSLPSSFFGKLKPNFEQVMRVKEAILQGTCGGQLTLPKAQEYHRLCRCPPAPCVMVQVTQPMEEDPFEGLPTLVEGIHLGQEWPEPTTQELETTCGHQFDGHDDPMTVLLKASVGPTLPDLAELFKGLNLPTSGGITKQRRAKPSQKACAVSA